MLERALDDLPPPLDEATIVALNRPEGDLHTTREYTWNDGVLTYLFRCTR